MSALPDSFIRFEPIYQTRVWGGRLLAERFGRDLPDPELPFGESWEISARAEADSRVVGGSLDGRRLTELWSDRELRSVLFGEEAPEVGNFPLLFKILDARDTLSIQVHPPASVAADLGGEPKTEVWYIADAAPGRMLYVGVKEEVDEARFREALIRGEAESCVHAVPVKKGTASLYPERTPPCHRRGAAHLRDPAKLRHDLPRLRLEPSRHRRQAARAPCRGIPPLHRFLRRDPGDG
jgi:mannose-6-phosphate isomerase